MAHCEGLVLKKTPLLFLIGILVWFSPLFCWCLNLTPLDLQGMQASEFVDGVFPAALAIDGNSDTNTRNNHCAHTDAASHPWWKVDLGANHCLGRITLVNRGDCCSDRLIGAVVRAGIESDIFNNAACGLPVTSGQTSTPGAHIPILCDPPVIARYVSVDDDDHLNGPEENVLTLCEVIVEEHPMEDCPQITTAIANTCMSTLMFTEKRITDPRPLLAEVSMKSPMQCFLSCKMNINECWSFDYVMTSGQCRLYDVKAGDLKLDDTPGCLVYAVVRG